MDKTSDEAELAIIADWMKDGNVSRVARAHGKKRETIYRILKRNGARRDDKTIQDVIRDGEHICKTAERYADSIIPLEVLQEEIERYRWAWVDQRVK